MDEIENVKVVKVLQKLSPTNLLNHLRLLSDGINNGILFYKSFHVV